ncbi:MAG TPA: TIM-barrel domain-containing protein [Candidatus Sulfotelmatobacter sp.]|nr:TIM-barrel domain-containing protein [Candidatus Sulfotelmatobacter sp.]
MAPKWNRREVLKGFAAFSGAILIRPERVPSENATEGGAAPEIQITPVSDHTSRVTFRRINQGSQRSIVDDGSLARESWGNPVSTVPQGDGKEITVGNFRFKISWRPVSVNVSNQKTGSTQRFEWDENSGALSFLTGAKPLFGLGEGGPQYDRRGSTDEMRSGQGGYKLATHGGRVPIPWVIGTEGWAIFFHLPLGTFDFTGERSRFIPKNPDGALPLDLFLVAATDPPTIMAEYARLTGLPELPPLWSLGYQQSHRTLASREEVITEAKTFREKKLPCDAMIYLGTGFCPSGWNTENGSFAWNPRVFSDPKEVLDELHKAHFRAVMHVVILSDQLHGTVHDPCELSQFDEAAASCYWATHRRDQAMGIDGWWPDEGDPLDSRSRLTRNRMYWEGPQIDRPNQRPYALHRNGNAGMQRYASFLWSGDVYSTWETLKTHIPVALNTALSGIPYWGTDIGGFVPTPEFTAELYVRWFQFGAFCPLFRCHGRTWKLRLPWGWNTGDPGPVEISNYKGAAIPDSSQLHDARVEPICRKYLELRYRMLPYLYSTVHECTKTGMPIMRPLWLHFPNDPKSSGCGYEYLWGKSMLVAPVFEKEASSRRIYLPPATWYDFWTGERLEGGREIDRPVDLETLPLYVRGGSIQPFGPVKQYVDEKVDAPLLLSIFPGADASFLLYEDDGISFDYRSGHWMGIAMTWNDASRTLDLKLAPGSRMLSPAARMIDVQLLGEKKSTSFQGKPVSISFQPK